MGRGLVLELNNIDEVTDYYASEAFAVGNFSRALRYQLLNALSKSQQCSDDERTVQLQYVKKDRQLKETI